MKPLWERFAKINAGNKVSYSQSGEDLLVGNIIVALNLVDFSYIDIGAHHPLYLSNTALYYKMGCRGINIEPDPVLFKAFTKQRRKDVNLNIGIGPQKDSMDFFIMAPSTMNTFSKEQAEKLVSENGMQIKQVLPIAVDTINNIIDKYNQGIFPDFLSIDIESLDFEVLKSIDYKTRFPKIICVETITYSPTRKGKKENEIIDFLQMNGYFFYADTYINSLFVHRSFWNEE